MSSTPSPTARSLDLLRRRGYLAEVVEQNIPHARTKRDLYGFVDIVAIGVGETLAVQTTSVDHVSHRVEKITASPNLNRVKLGGWRVVVHGWRPWDYAGVLPALKEVEL